ncbi:protein TonB [Paraburkholderia sp. MM5496-R1]|uniref:energy transducer TonB n=1 Tax=unclassified Paraburkholderia TaxID=2615204 RepID=UPI001655DE01|nr:energy transducer TonB [Paraburkholderia sp. 31.1]MBC8724532.1 energy transducer TonB [Paraburkholderia sp. 31.1]
MSSPAIDMKDPQNRLDGALWASTTPAHHGRMPMKLAIGVAVLVEALVILGVSHMKFQPPPPPPPKEMRVQIAPPPPPPPPPEVKKLEPPPAPPKAQPKHEIPKPTPTPPPPRPTPQPVIQPTANPAPNAPAIASPTPAPAPAPAPAAPPAPPALHGVVDGRGHCQSVQPVIPRKALTDGISADVIAHLTIGTDGKVSDVKIMRVTPPTSVFNEAVIAAGKAYKCEKNAEPYVGEVQFSFKTTPSDDE